jgi:hypothetical protein
MKENKESLNWKKFKNQENDKKKMMTKLDTTIKWNKMLKDEIKKKKQLKKALKVKTNSN